MFTQEELDLSTMKTKLYVALINKTYALTPSESRILSALSLDDDVIGIVRNVLRNKNAL